MTKNKNWKEAWRLEDSFQYLKRENNRRCKGFRKLINYIDAPFCLLLYGATFHDYMELKFYNKSFRSRKTFLTTKYVQSIVKKADKELRNIIDNKYLFNKHYHQYIKREWLNLEACSFEDFKSFSERHSDFFLKAKRESSGIGISRIYTADISNLQAFYQQHQDKMVEETIVQHPKMHALNPTSINTVRVVTVSNNGKVSILSTFLRTGTKGKFTDNCGSDGIFAQLNVNTGVCFTDGVNYQGDSFEYHPTNNIRFKGFEVPNWDNIIATTKEAALVIPEIKIIGWDVAILKDGCELIEGNPGSGAAAMQQADDIGKLDLLNQYLNQ